MPSDARLPAALSAIAPAIAAYRAALAETVDRVDHYLAATAPDLPHERVAAELGPFAATRIDVERFASFVSGAPTLDYAQRAILAGACDVLREFQSLREDAFVLELLPGTRLGVAVAGRLAELGRPFGAATIAELVKTGRYESDKHDGFFTRFPYERWNRVERAAAPPLVVVLNGADLWAGDVVPYLDGTQHIVFVVRGGCAPAPLARLISPSVTVLQTSKLDALGTLAASQGPAVAALVPDGAAEFVHVPHEALAVSFLPQLTKRATGGVARDGGASVAQQHEDLALLSALATATTKAASDARNVPGLSVGVDPVDRLAGWLLSQASG